jgi:hypothetical protein
LVGVVVCVVEADLKVRLYKVRLYKVRLCAKTA